MSETGGTLNIWFEAANGNNYVVLQEPALPDTINRQDTVSAIKDSVPPKPTWAQIKHWRWLKEKKLLVGGSRYIQPKNDTKLVSSTSIDSKTLGLPVREKNSSNTDSLTILLLLLLLLFATVRVGYSKYISYLFQSLINYSISSRLFSEKNYPISHGAVRLNVIFYFTFSLFLYQVITFFKVRLIHESLPLFVLSLIVVLSYFIVKKAVYYLLGLVFETSAETSEYLFNMDNFSRTLGIVLFPVVVLINYYPTENPVFMVVTGVVLVGVFYAFLLQRGIYILLRKQFSLFYLFLYLCTLEILPLLLIYKVVVL